MAAVSKAIDRAGFATIAVGSGSVSPTPNTTWMDVASMEKLFLPRLTFRCAGESARVGPRSSSAAS